jgi:hypothetical protein
MIKLQTFGWINNEILINDVTDGFWTFGVLVRIKVKKPLAKVRGFFYAWRKAPGIQSFMARVGILYFLFVLLLLLNRREKKHGQNLINS